MTEYYFNLLLYDQIVAGVAYLKRRGVSGSVKQSVLVHDPIRPSTSRGPPLVEYQRLLHPDKLPRLCCPQYFSVRACSLPETPFGCPVWPASIPSSFLIQSHKEVPFSLPNRQSCKLNSVSFEC